LAQHRGGSMLRRVVGYFQCELMYDPLLSEFLKLSQSDLLTFS
jgi:hypothetical protein